MKVTLIENEGEKFAVNKDQAGAFGYSSDTGNSIFSKILNYGKKRGVRVPTMYMAYMYSIFKENGHEVEFSESLPTNNPDLVIIMSSIVDYKNELRTAEEIRKRSNAKIGFIGSFATTNPEVFLEKSDFVISGEPEDATRKLASGEIEPKGIILSKLLDDLDTLSFPNWDDYKISKYGYFPLLKKKPFFPILSSRGCPFDCSYCPYMVLETPQWRKRSPENVVNEIEHNITTYGMKSFLFRDPIFTLDKKRTEEICNLIIKKNLDVDWVCETRIDSVDEELIDSMKNAGLKAINIGVEAFDLKLLKNMNRKPPSHELQERLVNYSEDNDVKIMAFYVLGIPGQTKEDVNKTLEYSKYLNTSYAQFTIATPYPGTKFHEEVKDNILEKENWENYTGYNSQIKLEHFSSKEILDIKETAYKEYYLRWNWIKNRAVGLIQ